MFADLTNQADDMGKNLQNLPDLRDIKLALSALEMLKGF